MTIDTHFQHQLRTYLLRTPISAKYCWFGWMLGAWSTPSHHPTQLCDIYISVYKYILISEWTRLFGLLRILDNLISGAVCYFCMTISVFCEIYTLRMRVIAHAALLWVGWFLTPSSGVGLVVSVPIIGAGTREIWKFWEGLERRLGKFGALLVVCIDRLDVVTCGVTRWLGRGCRAAWLGVGCAQWSACWSRGARGRRCCMGFVWRTVSRIFSCFADSEDLGACVMVSTGRWGLCAFCCWC